MNTTVNGASVETTSEGRGMSSRMGRRLMAALGVVSVALGTIGIFVPGLPTTCFLLLASYLFARSCPAMQRRLLEHPRLGGYIKMAQGRSMPMRAKVVSLAAMWGGIATSLALTGGASHALAMVLIALGLAGTVVILWWMGTAGRPRAVNATARASG